MGRGTGFGSWSEGVLVGLPGWEEVLVEVVARMDCFGWN